MALSEREQACINALGHVHDALLEVVRAMRAVIAEEPKLAPDVWMAMQPGLLDICTQLQRLTGLRKPRAPDAAPVPPAPPPKGPPTSAHA